MIEIIEKIQEIIITILKYSFPIACMLGAVLFFVYDISLRIYRSKHDSFLKRCNQITKNMTEFEVFELLSPAKVQGHSSASFYSKAYREIFHEEVPKQFALNHAIVWRMVPTFFVRLFHPGWTVIVTLQIIDGSVAIINIKDNLPPGKGTWEG